MLTDNICASGESSQPASYSKERLPLFAAYTRPRMRVSTTTSSSLISCAAPDARRFGQDDLFFPDDLSRGEVMRATPVNCLHSKRRVCLPSEARRALSE